MGELFFVVKGLIFTVLICFALQVQIGSETLEKRADRWVHTSKVGLFLQDTAAGGARALQNGYEWGKKMISGIPSSYQKSVNQTHWKMQSQTLERAASKEE